MLSRVVWKCSISCRFRMYFVNVFVFDILVEICHNSPYYMRPQRKRKIVKITKSRVFLQIPQIYTVYWLSVEKIES